VDRNLALELVRATEAAALAGARWMGKGDPKQADAAANDAMVRALHSIKMQGRIRIGRPALDGNERLMEGAAVGSEENGNALDVALDALECIDSVATGRPNAMSVVALNTAGAFMPVGGLYMEKIAVGPDAAGKIDLSASPLENLVNVASAKRCYVEDLTVSILDRDRHADLIRQVREAGARIQLIPDGDISSAIATAVGESGVDVMMGIGAARAGVLAAVALACVGGDMQCRFVAMRPEDDARIEALTGGEPRRRLGLRDLVGEGNALFAATGITAGDVLGGVHFRKGGASTHSVVMRQRSGTIRFIHANHFFDRKPKY
jgi:fructose-1,6-bisphosphatase II